MTAKRTATIAKGIVLTLGALSALYVGVNAWRVCQGPPLVTHPTDYCTRCHGDAKTLKAMNDKAGYDVAHPPFK